jgi:hypothetical protein
MLGRRNKRMWGKNASARPKIFRMLQVLPVRG